MNDESPKKSAETESAKPSDVVASDKPATEKVPPAAKPAPEKPPIQPGVYGTMLKEAGLSFEPLGPDATGKEVIKVNTDALLAVSQFLRDDSRCLFDLLLSVSGLDLKTHRQSIAHAYSTVHHTYVVIKTDCVDEHVPSLHPVWPASDWHEKEAYDLFGIIYDGHPDLRRILMPVDWIGHPLRKDYKEEDPRLIWNRR
jgi:NADH-quinone oxidoreductase subunit C